MWIDQILQRNLKNFSYNTRNAVIKVFYDKYTNAYFRMPQESCGLYLCNFLLKNIFYSAIS